MSTATLPRNCAKCGTEFNRPGTLCPVCLGVQAKARAVTIAAERAHSEQIITAREIASARPRTEWVEVLD